MGRLRLALVYACALLLCPLLTGSDAASAQEDYVPSNVAPGMAGGGLVPLESTAVELVAEEVTIKSAQSWGGFRATAVYELRNPGPKVPVRFGAPVTWEEGFVLPSGSTTDTEFIDGIEILLDGDRARCETAVASSPLPDHSVPGWCAVTLDVPQGRSRLELRFSGASPSKEILYPLWPTGFWKGRLGRLTIRVEAVTGLEQAMVLSPSGVKRQGNALVWSLTDVDLRQIREVHVLGPRHVWGQYFPGWERAAVALAGSASSTLPPDGGHRYDPAKAFDGDPGTAWCEGVPGDGEGQWLEVRAEAPARPGWECAFLDWTIVPGLAATPSTYVANGRPRRVKVGPCAGGPGVEAKIIKASGDGVSDARVHSAWKPDRMSALGPELERRPIWITPPPGAFGGERSCLRLTIVDAFPGEKFHDTCVSEFTPRLYCHPRP